MLGPFAWFRGTEVLRGRHERFAGRARWPRQSAGLFIGGGGLGLVAVERDVRLSLVFGLGALTVASRLVNREVSANLVFEAQLPRVGLGR